MLLITTWGNTPQLGPTGTRGPLLAGREHRSDGARLGTRRAHDKVAAAAVYTTGRVAAGPSRAFSSGMSFTWIPPTSWVTSRLYVLPSGTPHTTDGFAGTTVDVEVLIFSDLP